MDSEDGLAQVDDLVRQLSKHLGIDGPLNDLLLWNLNDLPDGFGKEGRKLDDMIKAAKPDLVIMDPLNAVFAGIERDNSTTSAAYKHLRTIMSKTGCTVVGVHHTRKTDSENLRDNESLDLADVSQWFQQARGPRLLINGSDVRLGIDKPSKSRITSDDGEIVLKGFERVRGEIPAIRIARVMDDDGEPCGYDQLSGAKLLGNEDQQEAFERLLHSFRFKQAKAVYGKADQATMDFLNKCIAAGILRKVHRGQYEKIESSSMDRDRFLSRCPRRPEGGVSGVRGQMALSALILNVLFTPPPTGASPEWADQQRDLLRSLRRTPLAEWSIKLFIIIYLSSIWPLSPASPLLPRRGDCWCEPDLNAAASRQTLRVVGFGRATADAVDQTWSSYRPPLHLRGATTPHRTERVGIQTP